MRQREKSFSNCRSRFLKTEMRKPSVRFLNFEVSYGSVWFLENRYLKFSSDSAVFRYVILYQQPVRKLSACNPEKHGYITEYHVFKILDSLHPTATGLDLLPAWFVRLGAPVFSKMLMRLCNLSIATSMFLYSGNKSAFVQYQRSPCLANVQTSAQYPLRLC